MGINEGELNKTEGRTTELSKEQMIIPHSGILSSVDKVYKLAR